MRGEGWLLTVGCSLAAVVGGCGGSSSPHTATATTTAAASRSVTHARATARPTPVPGPVRLAPNPWKEPGDVAPHPHAKVTKVIVHDFKRGTGAPIHAGDTVRVDFIEADYTTGKKFNEAWGNGRFPTGDIGLTPDGVLRGVIVGMDGMRVGGRRRIVIPPRLSGTEPLHLDYRRIIYYDVVARRIMARG